MAASASPASTTWSASSARPVCTRWLPSARTWSSPTWPRTSSGCRAPTDRADVSSDSESAVGIFREAADGYDAVRRRVVPAFDQFYGHVVRMLTTSPRRVLDLGAGTGLLSRIVAEAHPGARLVLVDGAAEMLEHARQALGDRIEAAR